MAVSRPSNLSELMNVRDDPSWYIDLTLGEIGGGKFAPKDLNQIESREEASVLKISGLDQGTFEALIDRYGARFTAIHLWKCPRISDLSPLEDCPELRLVAVYWNQRATRLWNLAKTPRLRGLQFEDFTRLRKLDDLSGAASLEELAFGDAIWVKAVIASLSPLADVHGLRRLWIHVRQVEDGRIQPLAELQKLEVIECSTNLFTTEELAWLRARLPDSTRGRVLEPIWRMDHAVAGTEGRAAKDVLVIGKRKPFLNSTSDADRIQRYIDAYWALVEHFRRNPDAEPA
jgi:hypothetical protein